MQQQQHHLEPLMSAAVVLSSRCPINSAAYAQALPHVLDSVSAFLDHATPAIWSLERACERGFGLRMLQRLAAHEAIAATASAVSNVSAMRANATVIKPVVDPFYRSYLASNALVVATRKGDLDVVQWICCEYCPTVVPVTAIVEAAAHNQLRVLQWLYETYPSIHPNVHVAFRAVISGHLNICQWVLSRNNLTLNDHEFLLRHAVRHGHVEIVRWLHEHQVQATSEAVDTTTAFDSQVLGFAIQGGHLAAAQFLFDAGYPVDPAHKPFFRNSLRRGGLEMLQWLHGQDLTQGTRGWMDKALEAGDLRTVKWVHENLPSDICSAGAGNNAARDGNLDIVEWLIANRAQGFSSAAMDRAAAGGHLKIVQRLHEHRTEGCTLAAMDLAAGIGHLDVVQWLHVNREEGCTTKAMDDAAGGGHLETVQWLHTNRAEGCTTTAMDQAAAQGHLDVVQWLHANRQEGCTTKAMDKAAKNGHLHVVKWLHEHRTEGCTTQAMDRAAKNDRLLVVEWLHEHRAEGCTTDAMDNTESVRMLQWLYDHRREGCTARATEMAVQLGTFEKLLFLQEKCMLHFSQSMEFPVGMRLRFEIFQWLRARWPEYDSAWQRRPELLPEFSEWPMFSQFEADGGSSIRGGDRA